MQPNRKTDQAAATLIEAMLRTLKQVVYLLGFVVAAMCLLSCKGEVSSAPARPTPRYRNFKHPFLLTRKVPLGE
jgi:hypothetical protein